MTARVRLREVAAPGWRRWVSQAAIVWALGYGSLRIYWALGAAPSPRPAAADLIAFTGWWSVALCGAAVATVLGLRRARWSWPLAVAAWGVAAVLVAASALVLLDVVGIILPGVGCLARLLAQVAVGFGTNLPRAAGSLLGFEAGFLLAGTVLPLALVYRWGRVFPRWVPLLAGRGVPRWLVLGPALGLGVGMTAYFGVSIVRFAIETVTGTWEQGAGSLPLWFFWVAMPAYLVWGLGLGVAALAYRRATRPPCQTCGR